LLRLPHPLQLLRRDPRENDSQDMVLFQVLSEATMSTRNLQPPSLPNNSAAALVIGVRAEKKRHRGVPGAGPGGSSRRRSRTRRGKGRGCGWAPWTLRRRRSRPTTGPPLECTAPELSSTSLPRSKPAGATAVGRPFE
ncbi:hypothetical protein Taro_017477, partial [Colocasia esculenta]|nr:hypothetical protein [Colocasia esculenta]